MNKWSTTKVHIGSFYEMICFRKLKSFSLDDEFLKITQEFLQEAMGKSYGISTMQLLFQRTDTVKPQKGKYIDDDRTFFCSELIAKLYKVLGVVSQEDPRASHAYYPGDFGADGTLQLSTDYELETDKVICKKNLRAGD
jgi:hypothetical protein